MRPGRTPGGGEPGRLPSCSLAGGSFTDAPLVLELGDPAEELPSLVGVAPWRLALLLLAPLLLVLPSQLVGSVLLIRRCMDSLHFCELALVDLLESKLALA